MELLAGMDQGPGGMSSGGGLGKTGEDELELTRQGRHVTDGKTPGAEV